uniref:Calcium-dependent secretion activator 1 n=1 Tax=Chelydra serpentina TaxID=8475 RepID=A0A8C3RT71_CHESE
MFLGVANSMNILARMKISKQQLQIVKDRFQAFLNGETQIVADEAFINAVQSYFEVFLKSDRVARMVQSGGCSANDSREVFKKHIEKRVRSLPEIDGLSKETVLSSWMAKFDAIYRGEEDPRKQQARMTDSSLFLQIQTNTAATLKPVTILVFEFQMHKG